MKCKLCKICNGKACLNQLPGMGGINNNVNFISNYEGWEKLSKSSEIIDNHSVTPRLAPMTGGIENAGYPDEKQFYFDLINCAINKNYNLSIGDGAPDEKLLWGIDAVKHYNKKASVFIKPYENKKIQQRLEWSSEIIEHGGIDIDAYNIVTMRNKANLEKKTPSQLLEIKNELNHKGIPFVIKGIFTRDDIQLLQDVKPDIAFISNHGGRIQTEQGSTADFLVNYKNEIKKYCDKIWIDGGIRTQSHINAAVHFGADEILIGRPVISEILKTLTKKS